MTVRRRFGLVAFAMLGFVFAACGGQFARNNSTGNNRFDQGHYEAALRAYHAAQVAAPDRPEAYFNAAAALVEMRELDEAMVALEQALETADGETAVTAYYNLGNVFFLNGRNG